MPVALCFAWKFLDGPTLCRSITCQSSYFHTYRQSIDGLEKLGIREAVVEGREKSKRDVTESTRRILCVFMGNSKDKEIVI